MLDKKTKIFIAGHKGMVGSAVLKHFSAEGYTNILTATKDKVDLMSQHNVDSFIKSHKPNIVILCAAKVGGIQANMKNPGRFLYDNLMIQNNVIHSSFTHGVKKFVFLGSSCIYPRECPQPMKEEYLLTGKVEPTNEGYAIAKIAGIKMLEGYYKQYGFRSISLMPCNLYGPNDSFDLEHSHVLSALVKRFSDAVAENHDEITLWGTGIARREFMHVNDVARAILFMTENYDDPSFINIGVGSDVGIRELAETIADKVGFRGKIKWDATKPDGMLRKCMDVSRMRALGFEPLIGLEQGIEQMVEIYKSAKSSL